MNGFSCLLLVGALAIGGHAEVEKERLVGAAVAEIGESHICAFKKRGAGVCSGDSGGPLVSGGQVVSVVSGGVACAKGFPDVYTRVESQLDYIHEIIDEKKSQEEMDD